MKRYVMLVDIRSNDPPELFLTGSFPDGNIVDAYSATFTASGGVEPFVYSITAGSLPTGLAFDTNTGVVSGTATGVGAYSITVTVTDGLGQTASVSDSFNITSGPPLEITNSAPSTHQSPAGATNVTGRTAWFDSTDPAKVGNVYDPSFVAVASNGDVVRAIKSASSSHYMRSGATTVTYQDDGLGGQDCISQSSSDVITRFHVSPQSSPWSPVAASTLVSASALTIVFCGSIASVSTNNATVYTNACIFRDDSSYVGLHLKDSGVALSAHAYTWDGGEKAAGIAISRDALCTIAMRLSAGTLSIRFNGGAWTSVASGNIQVLTGVAAGLNFVGKQRHLVFFNAGLSDAQIAAIESAFMAGTYSHTYTATGGTAPYTWSVVSGSLPTGLTLSSAGVLSGIPSVDGVFNFTVRVTDDDGFTDDLAQTITVT